MAERTAKNLTVKERTKELSTRLAGSAGFDKVTIFAADGKLILEGCVESYALKHRAEETARDIGFADIDNHVRVYPCEQEAPARFPRSSSTGAQLGRRHAG